jgi:hypothetical protein
VRDDWTAIESSISPGLRTGANRGDSSVSRRALSREWQLASGLHRTASRWARLAARPATGPEYSRHWDGRQTSSQSVTSTAFPPASPARAASTLVAGVALTSTAS